MANINDTATALKLFEEAAIGHAAATESGDYKVANKCYYTIIKAITFLREQDEILRLLQLFDHSSIGVRTWAATYLLPIKEQDAVNVLEEIAKEKGILAFGAQTTLSQWRKGRLKL